MFKSALIFLLFLSLFSHSKFFAPSESGITTHSAETAPTPELLPEIENLTLSKDVVMSWCPYSFLPDEQQVCPKSRENINVSTIIKNTGDSGVDYYYLITGGKIFGEGPNVVWNFEKARPGKYEITAGIGKDNVLFGKTITKTIELKECSSCDKFCACPNISIYGPATPVKAGNSVIFKVGMSEHKEYFTYKWSVSAGTISTDPGKRHIIVKTTPEMAGKTLTATVEIGGLCHQCPPTESKTISFRKN